jgi:trans-aconitate 2-methyltransferase
VSVPQQRWGANVVERLVLDGDELLLDAGCGTGRVTAMLLDRLPRGRVLALDASRQMLEEAAHNLARYAGRVEYVEANLADPLPIKEPLDGVFSTATFHWVPDHDALFRNLAAVIRPGGQLVAQCGGAGNLDSVGEVLEGRGLRWPSWAFDDAESTAAALADAGFVDIQTWLNPEPTIFSSREDMAEYLRTVVLRTYLEAAPEDEREGLLEGVLDLLGLELDYVRLNIVAIRG